MRQCQRSGVSVNVDRNVPISDKKAPAMDGLRLFVLIEFGFVHERAVEQRALKSKDSECFSGS
jgi:hypothetical protein